MNLRAGLLTLSEWLEWRFRRATTGMRREKVRA